MGFLQPRTERLVSGKKGVAGDLVREIEREQLRGLQIEPVGIEFLAGPEGFDRLVDARLAEKDRPQNPVSRKKSGIDFDRAPQGGFRLLEPPELPQDVGQDDIRFRALELELYGPPNAALGFCQSPAPEKQIPQIVVRLGVCGIERQRRLERPDRAVDVAEGRKPHPKVEMSSRVSGCAVRRLAIMLARLPRVAAAIGPVSFGDQPVSPLRRIRRGVRLTTREEEILEQSPQHDRNGWRSAARSCHPGTDFSGSSILAGLSP